MFDSVFDPNKDSFIMLGIKFVELSLAVEILYTYQTLSQLGGWWWVPASSMEGLVKWYITWWVNNINLVLYIIMQRPILLTDFSKVL